MPSPENLSPGSSVLKPRFYLFLQNCAICKFHRPDFSGCLARNFAKVLSGVARNILFFANQDRWTWSKLSSCSRLLFLEDTVSLDALRSRRHKTSSGVQKTFRVAENEFWRTVSHFRFRIPKIYSFFGWNENLDCPKLSGEDFTVSVHHTIAPAQYCCDVPRNVNSLSLSLWYIYGPFLVELHMLAQCRVTFKQESQPRNPDTPTP